MREAFIGFCLFWTSPCHRLWGISSTGNSVNQILPASRRPFRFPFRDIAFFPKRKPIWCGGRHERSRAKVRDPRKLKVCPIKASTL